MFPNHYPDKVRVRLKQILATDNSPRNERCRHAREASPAALPGFGTRVHLAETQMVPELHPTPGSSLQLPLQTSGVYFAEVVVREGLHRLSSN